jgi:hypothetical protein
MAPASVTAAIAFIALLWSTFVSFIVLPPAPALVAAVHLDKRNPPLRVSRNFLRALCSQAFYSFTSFCTRLL